MPPIINLLKPFLKKLYIPILEFYTCMRYSAYTDLVVNHMRLYITFEIILLSIGILLNKSKSLIKQRQTMQEDILNL